MALYNSDGTIYKLSGPNPVMKSQELWNGFELHNMSWQEEKAEDVNKVKPMETDFNVKNLFLSELEQTKPEIKVVETRPEPKEESQEIERKVVVIADKKDISESSDSLDSIEKVFIHCLPAKLRERKDSLYGDSYNTIQYGKPTSFEGVVLKQEDLFVEIWTDVEISIGSILYPKENYKRWWRVQEKESKVKGWLLVATPSDYQPSFD